MGFGHRVYKNYDPRARIIKKHVDEVLEATEYNPLIEIATELEKRALDDEFFTSRKLYPNVDFYSGLIYEALEIPTEMFTCIFAIPRTAGWVAQWLEMIDDSEQKIARPRQIYTGDRDVDYVPIAEREGPEKITNEFAPPARSAHAGALERYKLTVRQGPRVAREKFEDLDAAIEALERQREGDPLGGAARRPRRCCASSSPRSRSPAGSRSRPAACCAAAQDAGHRRDGRRHVRRVLRRDAPGRARPGQPRAVRRGAEGALVSDRRRSRRAATPPGAGRGCRAARRSRSGCTSTASSSRAARSGTSATARSSSPGRSSRRRSRTGRWMAMYLGLFGSYRKNETVDIEYTLGGEPKLAADVEITE